MKRHRAAGGMKWDTFRLTSAERRQIALVELVAGTSREVTARRCGISIRALDRIAADSSFLGELEAARRRRARQG